jgi:hydroxyacylglutathione hydrolase
MPAVGQPVPISRHVFVVYSEYPHRHSANSYLILGAQPVLIDCGCECAIPTLVSNLHQLGIDVPDLHAVVATHGDYDHIHGFHTLLEQNSSLKLMIHWADWPSGVDDTPYRNSSYVYGRPFMPIAEDSCVALADGDVLPAGDGTLEVVHTPGHTSGSICLHGAFDDRSMLFTGDVFRGAMKSLESTDAVSWAQAVVQWHVSLGRLSAMAFDWVLNGHEPARSLPFVRSQFDASVRQFGMMMNPWFSLGADEAAELEPGAAPVVAAPAYS